MLPNYGTVETTKVLQPLTSGQKFRLATAGVFDWGSFGFNGVLSAIGQARNDPSAWGQGWDAYGKRYGAGLLILYDGLSNELKEFWPDIRRKVFHKQDPVQAGNPNSATDALTSEANHRN